MVATQRIFVCSPLFGEMIHFDEHIFQMGWFNHQLVVDSADSTTLAPIFVSVFWL